MTALPKPDKKTTLTISQRIRNAVRFFPFLLYLGLMGLTLVTPPSSGNEKPSLSVFANPLLYEILKWTLAGLLVILFLRPLVQGNSQRHWYIFRLIRPLTVAHNIVVIAATIGLAYGLYSLFPFLDRSWLYLVAGADQATNIAVMPATLPYIGVLYLALFALNIPLFAAAEESRYRRGTKNWRDGAWRSLRFGLAHWIMGIPLFAALALTLPGLWYTLIYLRDGEDAATTHHATYNLILCFLLFLIACFPSLLKL